ncbi:MAG: hypothetical protein GY810_01360 [Aureispira sp.]|nr:hypothetical protein [Aureispira sp.]
MKANKIGIVYIALIGALIATLCDKNHVETGTLYYPNPFWDGQPWWNYPAFFVAFVLMSFAYHELTQRLPSTIDRTFSTSTGDTKDFTESLIIFALVYILSGFGNESPIFLNVLFYGLFLLRLTITPDKVFILIISIMLGIGGAFIEGFMSNMDLVYYTKPVIYYVPLWLAGLYLHGAFALRDGMRLFVYKQD